MDRGAHLADEELVLAADGEISPSRASEIRDHLAACWMCRARQQELDGAAVGFVREYRNALNPLLPPAATPRAQLRVRMADCRPPVESARDVRPMAWQIVGAAVVVVGCLIVWSAYRTRRPVYAPSPRLTPGVARAVDREQLCNSQLPKNQVVTADMRRRVFQVYGLSGVDPQAYEVDYLITPALGGADDIRNLWPQPYVSTAWNARVKDALEDRLRDLVCHGQLDLAEAQRDISRDWIAAYKKYFGTNEPPR